MSDEEDPQDRVQEREITITAPDDMDLSEVIDLLNHPDALEERDDVSIEVDPAVKPGEDCPECGNTIEKPNDHSKHCPLKPFGR